jgi:quinoprotein glucose dehydrogenase
MSTSMCAIFLGTYQPFVTPAELAPALGSKTVTDGTVVDEKVDSVDWPVYGGNSAGDRYSVLARYTNNVNDLKIAWRYDTGEGGLQTSPLMIDGTLYAATPAQKIIALNATTEQLKWQFDPATFGQAVGGNASRQPVRGLTYWKAGHERRLLAGAGTHLYALNPETGIVIKAFGTNGRVDLRQGLDRDPQTLGVFLTSPGSRDPKGPQGSAYIAFALPRTH